MTSRSTRRGYTGKCKAMKRTFKLTLLVCLLLLANIFTLTSCFMFTETQDDKSAESVPFTTLTYEGSGSKVIKNIVVPKGKFIISGYAKLNGGYYGDFDMELTNSNGKLTVYWNTHVSSDTLTVEKADFFNGPIDGGILEIRANDSISWTITIEKAG